MRSLFKTSLLFAFLIVVCLFQLPGCGGKSYTQPKIETGNVVSNNLVKLGLILLEEIEDHQNFARSFSDLSSLRGNESLFVLPGTPIGHPETVQKWTDFIYVGKTPADMVPGAALVISPPENHNGEYGYVLFSDARVAKLPAQTVRALVVKPWLFATNTAPEVIDYYKRQIKIWVPDRLASAYPHR